MPISEDCAIWSETPYQQAISPTKPASGPPSSSTDGAAGIVTSVAVVAALAVPGALLVRDQSGSVNGAAGSGGAEPSPAATSATAVLSTVVTKVLPQPHQLSAADKARYAKAVALLGDGFTQPFNGVLVDASSGRQVGTVATFVATDGGGDGQHRVGRRGHDRGAGSRAVGFRDPAVTWRDPCGRRGGQRGCTPERHCAQSGHRRHRRQRLCCRPRRPRSIGWPRHRRRGVGHDHNPRHQRRRERHGQHERRADRQRQGGAGKAGSPAILPGKAAATFANALVKAAS